MSHINPAWPAAGDSAWASPLLTGLNLQTNQINSHDDQLAGLNSSQITPVGADPTGVADSTTALTNWLATAKSQNAIAYLPPGTYKSASGLAYNAKGARIMGAGLNVSIINFTDNTNHLLRVGGGTEGNAGKGGFVRDISLIGPTARPTKNGMAGLCVDGMNYAGIERVEVQNADKAFEFIHNNYGTYGLALVAKYSTCNVGINLPTGSQSGSDLPFYDCWVSGQVRGVSMSGGGSGYSFTGGQFGCGYVADGTADAIWTMGSDYDSGATAGLSAVAIRSVDMENWNDGYAIHTYAQVNFSFDTAEFLATAATAGHYAAGILNMEGASASQVRFVNCTAKGTFTNAALAAVAGKSSDFHLFETGWRVNTPTTIAGVAQTGGSTWMRSLATQSGLSNGYSSITGKNSKARITLDGLTLLNNGGTLGVSTDDGTTINAVGAGDLYVISSGSWFQNSAEGLTTQALTSGTMLLIPVDLPSTQNYKAVAINVTTAGAAGTLIRLGLYPMKSNGMPDYANLIGDFGTVDGTTTGIKTITGLTIPATRGRAFFAVVAQGGAPSVQATTGLGLNFPLPSSVATPSASSNYQLIQCTGVTGALPTTASSAAGVGVPPKFFLQAT